MELIDYDPSQPRRTFKEDSIEELGVSIRTHGVLEPVSLRTHPQLPGRYMVNRGERRVRAARKAGLRTVPAFIDERVDPFAQAAENLHREDMSPFDLAAFVCAREKEGLSKSEIARRLAKPRTYISEAAALVDAPEQVRTAVETGRLGSDVRMLHRLVAAARSFPQRVEELLAGNAPINRSSVETLLGDSARPPSAVASPAAGIVQPPKVISGGRTVLVVEHGGRRGSLRLKAQDCDVGEVRFGDGTRSLLPLADLRPVCWATEEPS
ncbi:Chromosome (plasmid) partitioning protein ParB [Variovorax sp. WDL1]|nr:Chromosome (plasmid) partitioning protein ParB [Variovorax sp. WDL1]